MSTVDSANQPNDTINTETIKDSINAIPTDKKEEEQPTPNVNDSTTDSSIKISDQNECQLLAEAQQLMQQKDYYSASDLLSNALSILQQKNIATSIESIPYYINYGESLLRLIQSSNELFAAPQQQEQEQEPEAPLLITDTTDANTKEEQDEDVDLDQNKATESVINGAIEPIANGNEEPTANGDSKPVANGDIEEPTANGDTEEPVAIVDTSCDREIAWETFEYARTILEDYLAQNKGDTVYIAKLALVHSFLGELLIEDENNEEALKEFETALELQNGCKGQIKHRQRAFDRFMSCLAAQFCNKDEDALKHCNIALNEISQRIIALLNDECKENEYEVLMERAQNALDKMAESDDGKELKELVGSMADLMSKLDEIKSVMQYKAKEKENENANTKEKVNDVGGDPLMMLIQGLTSKFGIQESDLAKYDEMREREEGKNKVKNNGNTNNEGVTTIGFGNADDDSEINELGSFGAKKKERKKRSLEEAGIVDDGLETNVKRIKLNTGDALNTEEQMKLK